MYFGFTGAAYDIDKEAALRPGQSMEVRGLPAALRPAAHGGRPDQAHGLHRHDGARGRQGAGARLARQVHLPHAAGDADHRGGDPLHAARRRLRDHEQREPGDQARHVPRDRAPAGGVDLDRRAAHDVRRLRAACRPRCRGAGRSQRQRRRALPLARPWRPRCCSLLACAALALLFGASRLAHGQGGLELADGGPRRDDDAEEKQLFERVLCKCGGCPRLPLSSCVVRLGGGEARRDPRRAGDAASRPSRSRRTTARSTAPKSLAIPATRASIARCGRCRWR